MELICMELGAYQELKNRLCRLSVTMADFSHHIEPATQEKWLDAQDVCLALDISKRTLQTYRDNGKLPYSTVGNKYFYKETDVDKVLQEGMNKV